MVFPEKTIQLLKDKFGKLADEEKRRIILICTGVFVVILVFSVILSLVNPKKEAYQSGSVNTAVRRGADPGVLSVSPRIIIPADEIFLPAEPDFIPGVLLEREKRLSWSEQDAEEYWQDPLKFGEEPWRDMIEDVIDKYLERIP